MTKKVYIKGRKRQAGQYQFYMNQFVEAAAKGGIVVRTSFVYDVSLRLNNYLSSFRNWMKRFKAKAKEDDKPTKKIGRTIAGEGTFLKWVQNLYPYIGRKHTKKAVIITSRADTLLMNSFPFFYRNEIIPMLWDVWPYMWDRLYSDLRFLHCRIAFVTVRAMAEKLSKDFGIRAYWIPEGIDVDSLRPGDDLRHRTIDIYELGRQKIDYHIILETLHQDGKIGTYYRNVYDERRRLCKLAFPTAESLLEALPQIKVIVSFPRVDTHPEVAGGLDTLTQRYWEAMLCRCLIVGRAPQELVDLIGYNPVIDVDWQSPEKQIVEILGNISQYQDLVDKNYQAATKWASWDGRIAEMMKILRQNGYTVG